ncbi:ATP-binding protein [Rheinheimera baltica]|uniref:histidine kinase n=1 Tax=Rheinheimera baltica TaxID=67576 RepID=A0ABT9I4E8_9GAMM|nr:7TM diverse intracellular signaling domain-containing protein [Rheinheimera baltica]MDP5138265.1 ATP-binding protein [Rheinheimera baltica]
MITNLRYTLTLLVPALLALLLLSAGLFSPADAALSKHSAPLPELTFSLAVLEDKEQQLTVMQLASDASQSAFTPLALTKFSAGYSQSAFWLRITPGKGWEGLAEPHFISLDYPLLQDIEVYKLPRTAPVNSQPERIGRAGSAIPMAERTSGTTVHYIPVGAAASENVFLLRIVSNTSVSVPVEIVSATQREQRIVQKYLWVGFILGVLLLLVIFNALVAIWTKDKANAIYVLFLVTIVSVFISVTGIGSTHLWPDAGPNMLWLVPVSLYAFSISSYLFTLEYFQSRALPGKVAIALKALVCWSVLLLLLSGLFSYATAMLLAVYNALMMVFILFTVALLASLKGMQGARLYLVGRFFVLTGGVLQFLKTYGYIAAYPATEYILFLGAILEAIVLSSGLALRADRLEQEKDQARASLLHSKETSLQALSDVNAKLAQEVAERIQTEKVQKTLFTISELAAGDADMHSFLKDVHQSISSLLFARNFFVALYDKQQQTIQFPYIADEKDTDLPQPQDKVAVEKLNGSWTLWILQHGIALYGDEDKIVKQSGLQPRFGSVARYWLGLPLFSEQQTYGVLCLQIYDDRPGYTDEERRLLEYVSRHISQALQRKQYRAQLEAQVQERTQAYRDSLQALEQVNRQLNLADKQTQLHLKQVKALLDNTGQGFLTCNSALQLEPEYSKECLKIFNAPRLSGDIVNLLAADNNNLQALYQDVLPEVLMADQPADMVHTYLSLLPNELQLAGRYYDLQYKKISVDQVMVILSDITEQKTLQHELLQQQQQAGFIVYALTQSDEVRATLLAFRQFIDTQLANKIWSNPGNAELRELFREVHTYKGLLAQIYCPHFPEVLHQLEEALQNILNDPAMAVGFHLSEAQFEQLSALLADVMAVLEQHLGGNFFTQEKMLPVPLSLVQQLQANFAAQGNQPLAKLLQQLQYKSLKEALACHFVTAQRLARQQGKLLQPVNYLGDTVFLDTDYYQPLIHAMVHLFRNAVDHGIELPEERLSDGKIAAATLSCHVQYQDQRLFINISDDGRGIAVEQIKHYAVEKALADNSALQQMNDDDILQLIFAEELTTKSAVTQLSGRGVGLSALKHQCSKFSATIRVSSLAGQGCSFEMVVPLVEGTFILDQTATPRSG